MTKSLLIAILAVFMLAILVAASSKPPASAKVERGKYLVQIGGCNDCHTAGYLQANGAVPPTEWLTGDALGFKGPWGTSYPKNLRLLMSNLTEKEWIAYAKSAKGLPPMPWFNLHAMKEEDLGAIYAFVRTLKPIGGATPAALPPGVEPVGPFINFSVQVNPGNQTK